jgi:hypothetical protein
MQVFTTIFLAETPRDNIQRVDQANSLDQDQHGLAEFKQALRERIVILESRGWSEGDDFDEE